ncbi:hypothetical protein FHR81_004043 [Actinoalloteichus hoggarensis]|uniref:Uncharacterized protein n=1 Tax=Actinoalloteichus hoggarensis TaxID=1470176 RepID=A0A221WAR4_9PSEU|nr:hypothetical protein AHOG_24970 [Actinoalloteichus hoggarensis]MBB5922976.1 hypothetical protein [Actinoalloteichus hoggarensis]
MTERQNPSQSPWEAEAARRITADPAAIRTLFPAVGREVGREVLQPDTDPQGMVHGTRDDLTRVMLLGVLASVCSPTQVATEIADLYRYGDDAERRGVLRGLDVVTAAQEPGEGLDRLVDAALILVRDALRANDVRLVAAAMGPFAGSRLDAHSWRHGVLKCVFTGVPLAAVARLAERADPELLRMVEDFAAERRAAGREVPADALELLGRVARNGTGAAEAATSGPDGSPPGPAHDSGGTHTDPSSRPTQDQGRQH